jgi:hypothetical protein
MSELKPPFWHHVACNGSNNYPVGHPGMICNCKGWAIRGAQPCPTCAEKDAEIARLIAALEFERDPCRRAVSKDGRCEHEARATAAEQDALERQSIARELLTKLKAAEQERDTYREAVAARKAEMIEWRQAARTARTELAAAERREAEKDKRIAEIVWSMREAAVGRLVNGKVLEAYADALASPSTPSGESMGLSGDLIVTGQQPSTPSPAPSSTCPPCAQLLAWEAETRTATSTPSPAPSAEPHEAKLAELLALPENWGVDGAEARITEAAAETVRGLVMPWSIVPLPRGGLQIEMHRCGIELEIEVDPDGRVTGVLAGEDGNIENMAELEIPAPSPLPRSAPREAGAQPEAGEPKDTRRDCTCLGTCKGPEGLGPRWRCVMGREKPLPVAASEPKEQP